MTQPLVDRFGRAHTYLRISVTDRCNFRCRYCMPPEGLPWRPHDEILSYEEIERIARLFARMGVEKIRITGGEPTVRKQIETLMGRLSGIEGIHHLLMTTNGTTLAQKAPTYRAAGLTGVNVSMDSLKRERFAEITLRDELHRVLAGIDAALDAGIPSVKVNVVVIAGFNDDELLDFVEFTRERPVTMRFIEFMPFEGNDWSSNKVFGYREMVNRIEDRYTLRRVDTEPSAVGKDFAIDGFAGQIGFVTSMTESFCSDCNRVRLTAEGGFKPCLFAGAEFDLKAPMRAGATDEELETIIRDGLSRKWKEHPPMNQLLQVGNKAMVAIGG